MGGRGRLCTTAAALAALLVSACDSNDARAPATPPSSTVAVAPSPTSTPALTATPTPTPTPTPAPKHSPSTVHSTSATSAQVLARFAAASVSIHRLGGYLGKSGVSIAAVDERTGVTFGYGATAGMLSASIAKLGILEVLLLQHQHAHTSLSEDQRELATQMIEYSDNEAANDLWQHIGEGRGLKAAAKTLGLRHTVPADGIYWGFSTTSATDQIALLHNLTRPGPLTKASRSYALELLSDVEADQRWGVSAAADAHTETRQKNGWLPASPDNGRWLVNSVGIITADGHQVLIAVLTQHGPGFDSGIALVEKLAKITADAVTG